MWKCIKCGKTWKSGNERSLEQKCPYCHGVNPVRDDGQTIRDYRQIGSIWYICGKTQVEIVDNVKPYLSCKILAAKGRSQYINRIGEVVKVYYRQLYPRRNE